MERHRTELSDLHLQHHELVHIAHVDSDTIAERMRALGATPDGRPATVAAMTRLPAYRHGRQHTTTVVRLVFGSATAAVATMRAIHGRRRCPSTSDPLHALIVGLEKRMWMLAAQLGVMWHLHGDRLSSADEANWTLLRPNRSAWFPRSEGVFRGPEAET